MQRTPEMIQAFMLVFGVMIVWILWWQFGQFTWDGVLPTKDIFDILLFQLLKND